MRKSALVVELIRGKTSLSEASRPNDLVPSRIESRADDAKMGMESALRTDLSDVRQQYWTQLNDVREAWGGP